MRKIILSGYDKDSNVEVNGDNFFNRLIKKSDFRRKNESLLFDKRNKFPVNKLVNC